jgi:hypothetical protein
MSEQQRHIEETEKHRRKVKNRILRFCDDLSVRADSHDLSKLSEPELSGFSEILKVLESHPYGSPEYKESLSSGCIEHHYKANRHHPEHHENGISDMTLVDVVEMFCDWQAACERRPDGDIIKSVEFNSHRFGECSLWDILANTAKNEWGIGQLSLTRGKYPPYVTGWMCALQDMAENCMGALIKDVIERPEWVPDEDWPEFLRGYLTFDANG